MEAENPLEPCSGGPRIPKKTVAVGSESLGTQCIVRDAARLIAARIAQKDLYL